MIRRFNFKNSVINYYKYGNGEKVLFCLHGYAEDATSFSFLEKHLGSAYTFYAIDLPFHGATKWNEKEPMSPKNLIDIFNSINLNQNKKFSLLAYSFGGRIALQLVQNFPQQIERLVLIAPDGLHVNFWYWLSTQTLFGNRLFKASMQNPRYFFAGLYMADKTNLMNKSIIKFVHYFLDDESERTLLYKRWNAMKTFKPDISVIKKICVEKDIVIQFLFGNYDRIILSKHASDLKNAKNIFITTIDAGHRLLTETNALQIVTLLNS